MEWHVFTYINDTALSYRDWLEQLLTGLQAEQFTLIDKTTICVHHHSSQNDQFDENGIPL